MHRPALYFLIPYLLGIVIGRYTPVPSFWLWLFTSICLIGALLCQRFTKLKSKMPVYVLLHLAVFASGSLRLNIAEVSPIPTYFYDKPIHFSGRTVYQPERGEQWDACYAIGRIELLSTTTTPNGTEVDIHPPLHIH